MIEACIDVLPSSKGKGKGAGGGWERALTQHDIDNGHAQAGHQEGKKSPCSLAVLMQHCPVRQRHPRQVEHKAASVGDHQRVIVGLALDVCRHIDAQQEHDDQKLQHTIWLRLPRQVSHHDIAQCMMQHE